MKIYIAIGIMITLQSGKRFSAKDLADKFETSLKTIYRTIDILVSAGMPIISIQGKNGGYELIKGSIINSSFFTMDELSSFISFIKSNSEKLNTKKFSLEERLSQSYNKEIVDKLQSNSTKLVIDTALWLHNDRTKSICDDFKTFINNSEKVNIEYINLTSNKNDKRIIHPYTLVYKNNSWYIYAFCETRNSFRLFKLSRIEKYEKTNENFTKINIDILSKPWNKDFENNLERIEIELLCTPFILNDIKDWLGQDITINKQENSNLYHIKGYAYNSYGLLHKIFEFDNNIKILKPEKLKNSMCDKCLSLLNAYNN